MFFKRNLLQLITLIACSGTTICVLTHYLTNISPFIGIWFPLYLSCVFLFSVFISFKLIQLLLRLNKPLKCDLGFIERYSCFSRLRQYVPSEPGAVKQDECREYDTNELSVISTVLERKLVSSWYVPFISQEIGFSFACKQMLDQMIGKSFQICNKIETKDVFVDVCSILIGHLKEYKKAVKRHQKCPETSIESLYTMTQRNFNDKQDDSAEHCVKIVRMIMKDLVSWELWETPHSELLVRILSKKLLDFIDNTVANPLWINDKLLTLLKVPNLKQNQPANDVEDTDTLKVEKENKPLDDSNETKSPEPSVESALSQMITNSMAPILQNAEVESCEEVEANAVIAEETKTSDVVEATSSPILRQRRGRQGRSEVKIYDRVIEGSVKTWESEMDLQCCSLGQDLLASLDGEITLSRLWGQEPDQDPSQMWFGEEEILELELNPEERSPVKKEASPKPAELLKDLQTTVHQAKAKIGDLQDEAAGMMEGLLDFGIAGLRKGLRLTGLSDDSEKSPSHQARDASPAADSSRNKSVMDAASAVAALKEDSSAAPPHPLVKQQRVTSLDSALSQPQRVQGGDPPGVGALPPAGVGAPPPSESPEPQYEEVADLSTSIARLRTLLQQRADHSPTSMGDIWWEGVEETRGRTTLNTRHIDPASLADEYDMSGQRVSSPLAPNNMQRLDKLFHRTVTGVFNSIKTAVGEGGEPVTSQLRADWTYVAMSQDSSVGGAVSRLVGTRRARAHVDAARDSLALARTPAPPAPPAPPPDGFEETVWQQQARGAAAGELLAAAGLLRAHVALRLAALLLADVVETLTARWLDELARWLKEQLFLTFAQMAGDDGAVERDHRRLRDFDLDETVAALVGCAPALRAVFGEESLRRAGSQLAGSWQHARLNRQLAFRLLDAAALHFKRAAALRNPSFDAA